MPSCPAARVLCHQEQTTAWGTFAGTTKLSRLLCIYSVRLNWKKCTCKTDAGPLLCCCTLEQTVGDCTKDDRNCGSLLLLDVLAPTSSGIPRMKTSAVPMQLRGHLQHLWPQRGKVLRTAALQQVVSRTHADARVAALFVTLEADARGPAPLPKESELNDISRLQSWFWVFESAWLWRRPSFTGVTTIEVCVSAQATSRRGSLGWLPWSCSLRPRAIDDGGQNTLPHLRSIVVVVARHNWMAET